MLRCSIKIAGTGPGEGSLTPYQVLAAGAGPLLCVSAKNEKEVLQIQRQPSYGYGRETETQHYVCEIQADTVKEGEHDRGS